MQQPAAAMHEDCPLAAAVRRCPFLAQVGAREGEAFARRIAANPFASAAGQPPLLEEEGLSGYEATLRLFHGPGGVVPLRRFADAPAASAASGCPFRAAMAASAVASKPTSPADQPASMPAAAAAGCAAAAAAAQPAPAGGQPASRALPFASISLSGFGFVPDPGQFFNRPPRAKKQQQQPQQRKPADPGSSRGGGGSGARPGATSGSSPGASSGGSGGTRAGRLRPGQGGLGGPAGQFKRMLGGLLPLAAGGHLSCPAPIVKMRAAIAALKPVRDLRPQALPIRALAMSGTAIAAGLPCGAWREHTRKFSPQWFLAVHAAIPFVAMLRKAVLMPKWAILLTLIGSIAGQTVGARMERQRMVQLGARRQPSTHRAPAAAASQLTGAVPSPSTSSAAAGPARNDCVMPGLEAGCRQCLKAAQSAISWSLAPVVVQ